MFKFTTTNVINSIQDLTTGLPLWSLQKNMEEEDKTSLDIKRIGKFVKENVVAIYKAPAVQPQIAKARLDLTGLGNEGDHMRLNIYIRLSEGSNFSPYSNDTYYKGKPFWVDFVVKDTAANTAKALESVIKKFDMATQGEKMLTVKADDAELEIKAVNEYQNFAKVVVEKIDTAANHGLGEATPVLTAEVVAEDNDPEKKAVIVQGREGFGTYEWLLHNLRLPTTMRTVFKAINEEESPVPGATYTQFTIHYCVNRGPLGRNAVGDNVTSTTTHVIYFNDALLAKLPEGTLPDGQTAPAFESALGEIGTVVPVK